MSDLVCVTANLNKAHNTETLPWVHNVLGAQRPALFFGQELAPEKVQDLAEKYGYQLVAAPQRNARWWMGSWILARDELSVEPDTAEVWGNFECYLASAWLTLTGVGRVRLVSVHASPQLATSEHLSLWPELPSRRTGPTGRPNALRYSDLALHALSQFANEPLLAAGDFNESRHYDAPLGAQFFEKVTEAQLIDVTFAHWLEERQTRFHPTDPALQVDHVLATQEISRLVTSPPSIDPAWSTPERRSERSDHAPVWFTLST